MYQDKFITLQLLRGTVYAVFKSKYASISSFSTTGVHFADQILSVQIMSVRHQKRKPTAATEAENKARI